MAESVQNNTYREKEHSVGISGKNAACRSNLYVSQRTCHL